MLLFAKLTIIAALFRPSVFRQVTDFANVFKAFIGTNWIGLPFAFKQSGIVVSQKLADY